MTEKETIGVYGAGKLGLPLAALAAQAGYYVAVRDPYRKDLDLAIQGEVPLAEPGVQDILKAKSGRLTTLRHGYIDLPSLAFIVVPTPSDSNGRFSNDAILSTLSELAPILKVQRTVVVVVSTVMPGSMAIFRDKLETDTGLKCGKDFGLCYSPQFIALGSVVRNMLYPDFVLIGESDPISGDALEAFYGRFLPGKKPIRRTNWVNAELAKLSLNFALTCKITYANVVGYLCHLTPGADADVVLGIVGRDQRIGPQLLKAGTSYGGPCLPRDTVAFRAAHGAGCSCDLASTVGDFNYQLSAQIAACANKYRTRGHFIGVAGLAYKSGTPETTESAGLAIMANLTGAMGFDRNNETPYNGRRNSGMWSTAEFIIHDSEVIILALPDAITADEIRQHTTDRDVPLTIIDCWRSLTPAEIATFPPCVKVIPWGAGPSLLSSQDPPCPT
jgi:UDPglucose 6-dehydrogenase